MLTREDIVGLIPFRPHAGWDNHSDEELKSLIRFRIERMEDPDYLIAYTRLYQDEMERKAAKKAKKTGKPIEPVVLDITKMGPAFQRTMKRLEEQNGQADLSRPE